MPHTIDFDTSDINDLVKTSQFIHKNTQKLEFLLKQKIRRLKGDYFIENGDIDTINNQLQTYSSMYDQIRKLLNLHYRHNVINKPIEEARYLNIERQLPRNTDTLLNDTATLLRRYKYTYEKHMNLDEER